MRINYRIDSVLCLVDAKNIVTQLGRTSAEEGAVNEAVQQLAFADSVIINKTDLVDEDQLALVKAKINSVNAFAKVVQSEKVRTQEESSNDGRERGDETGPAINTITTILNHSCLCVVTLGRSFFSGSHRAHPDSVLTIYFY